MFWGDAHLENFGLCCWLVRATTMASQTDMDALGWAFPALLALRLDCTWEWFWGSKAFAFVDLSLTAKPHIALNLPPLFLLKDQFFMVLVLIVFIVFKSVFLYVEGNNFLNTNRYYCIKLSWSSCLINGHVKMVLSFSAPTSLLPLRKLWTPVSEMGLLRGGWTQPPPMGRGLCGMYRCRQAAWLALLR